MHLVQTLSKTRVEFAWVLRLLSGTGSLTNGVGFISPANEWSDNLHRDETEIEDSLEQGLVFPANYRKYPSELYNNVYGLVMSMLCLTVRNLTWLHKV